MSTNTSVDGWSRITPNLDVEINHGIPVRISSTDASTSIDESRLAREVEDLTGLHVTVQDWINIDTDERQCSVCVDKEAFIDVLHRLAKSSAALYVDRFHKAIDQSAVDWDRTEYTCDFNRAVKHCCLSWDVLDKQEYFEQYIDVMHKESTRLIDEKISPLTEAE